MGKEIASEFNIGYIAPGEVGAFGSLMLPEVRSRLEKGEPILALGVTSGKTAIAVVCGQVIDESIFDILSFYVAPDYRRQGAATLMMDTLISVLPEQIAIVTVDFVSMIMEDRTLDRFLGKYDGFTKSNSVLGIYETNLKGIMDSDPVKNGRFSSGAVSFSKLSDAELTELETFAATNVLERPEEGFKSPDIFSECSILLREGKEIVGYLVADDSMGGMFTISALYYEDNDMDLLTELLCAFTDAACRNKHSKSMTIYIPAASYELGEVLSQMLPGAKNLSHSYEYMLV